MTWLLFWELAHTSVLSGTLGAYPRGCLDCPEFRLVEILDAIESTAKGASNILRNGLNNITILVAIFGHYELGIFEKI